MNIYVQQTIHINMIRIGSLANSSVFQIGSSGIVRPSSYAYNTGGFTEPAPKPKMAPGGSVFEAPSVPLQAPVRLT